MSPLTAVLSRVKRSPGFTKLKSTTTSYRSDMPWRQFWTTTGSVSRPASVPMIVAVGGALPMSPEDSWKL